MNGDNYDSGGEWDTAISSNDKIDGHHEVVKQSRLLIKRSSWNCYRRMTVEFIIERRDGTSFRYATASIYLERTINQYNPIAILVMAKNMKEVPCNV